MATPRRRVAEAPTELPARNAALVALDAARSTASAVARRAAVAWRAVDPDVRQHFADLPLLATTLLGPRRQRLAAAKSDGHRVVLCVHGMGGHPHNFLPLRAWLAVGRRTRVYSVAYDEEAGLEKAAITVKRAVDRILKVNRLKDGSLDVLAHSMGGVVVRLALLDPRFAKKVGTLITAGTPHQGTHAARFVATPGGLELRPGSEVLEKLKRQLPWRGPPTLPRLVCFFSHADVLMLPAETAMVEGAENVELTGISHAGYLLWPRALRRLAEALADAEDGRVEVTSAPAW